jgi:cyclopropane fatty-acyl-phospholipid synthase-like methyltransferase
VQLIHGDVSRLPDLQGPFDLALDIGCFHSLPQESRQRYIANLGRWLRRGASYLLYTFLWQESDGSGWPGEADIVAMFARDFVPRDVTRGTEGDRISAWFTFERKPA